MTRIETIISEKERRGITIEQLSQSSGVPVSTLAKILCGTTAHPREATLAALENALFGKKNPLVGRAEKLNKNIMYVSDGYNDASTMLIDDSPVNETDYAWLGLEMGLKLFDEDFFATGRIDLPVQEREFL